MGTWEGDLTQGSHGEGKEAVSSADVDGGVCEPAGWKDPLGIRVWESKALRNPQKHGGGNALWEREAEAGGSA